MHNLALRSHRKAREATRPQNRPRLSATFAVRPARPTDATEIHGLVALFAGAELLPRTLDEIGHAVDSYVIVVDRHDRVLACAALREYSPSLGEVSSVAVSPEHQGLGLGTMAVRGVEALARRRGIDELFAVSNATHFFESLGYRREDLARYPEKLASYAELRRRGMRPTKKPCFRKAA